MPANGSISAQRILAHDYTASALLNPIPLADDPRPHVMRFHYAMRIGGIETQLLRQLPLMNQGPYRVSLCLTRREGELAQPLRDAGVDVDFLPVRGRLHPSGILAIRRFLRKKKVLIAHAHTRAIYVPVTIASKLAGTPVMIGSLHTAEPMNAKRALQERFLDSWRDQMFCVSNAVGDHYCAATGIKRERVKTVYNGIDIDAFAASQTLSRIEMRKDLGIGLADKVVLMAGRLAPEKEHEVLLKAIALLKVQLAGTRLRCLIVGDGDRRHFIEQQIKILGLEDEVRLLGLRNDMANIMCACDLSCLTSRFEGFSLVAVEGLAMGLPLVTTRAGGIVEAVQEGQNAFVVPVGDSQAIADKLVCLLNDDELRKKFARSGLEYCRSFSMENTVTRTEQLYSKLLEDKGFNMRRID